MTVRNKISGDKSVALIWTNDIDDSTKLQITKMLELPFIHKHLAIMPDVHGGVGSTIGTVIPTKGAIIPAAVGVDIGCVDSETEYLGETGWEKISKYSGGKVTQFNPDTGCGELVDPLHYINAEFEGSFIHFKTKYGVNQMLTPDHRCLVYKRDRSNTFSKSEVVLAEDIFNKHCKTKLGYRHRFLTTFGAPIHENPLDMSDDDLRVMVMVCADGSFPNKSNRCNLHFKKKRKIERAKMLLEMAGIEYTVHEYDEDLVRVSFISPYKFKTLALWNCSSIQCEVICSEVLEWDGTEDLGVFFSRDKETVDFVQYCFSVIGKRATITTDIRASGVDYRVVVSDNVKVGIYGSPKTEVTKVTEHNGRKYCFTVPSSFLVMRRGGNIFITGNCGMSAVKTNLTANDLPDNLKEIRLSIEESVPHGRSDNGKPDVDLGGWKGVYNSNVTNQWKTLVDQYEQIIEKHPKIDGNNHINHLGTLGGGNHFIEICLDESDDVWIMLHSGSRGIGNSIGRYFIEKAKEEMVKYHISDFLPSKDLSYLVKGTEVFDDYYHAVQWAQKFASANRKLMMGAVIDVLADRFEDFEILDGVISCHHNYVDIENHFGANVYVTRKGAIRARPKDMGIIPGSMGDCSYIVKGKGVASSFNSCSHGAGRKMSRNEANRIFTEEDLIKQTEGIECPKDASRIDEIPSAYKDIDEVMANQSDLVEIVHTLKQVINVKG